MASACSTTCTRTALDAMATIVLSSGSGQRMTKVLGLVDLSVARHVLTSERQECSSTENLMTTAADI